MLVNSGGTAYVSNCSISGNAASSSGKGVHVNGSNSLLVLGGSNVLEEVTGVSGGVILNSGAILDLTGNANPTPIAPGGDITFGANVTVINSAGVSSLLNGGVAGSCSIIKNDGTTE
jgi:hypothetical protein